MGGFTLKRSSFVVRVDYFEQLQLPLQPFNGQTHFTTRNHTQRSYCKSIPVLHLCDDMYCDNDGERVEVDCPNVGSNRSGN